MREVKSLGKPHPPASAKLNNEPDTNRKSSISSKETHEQKLSSEPVLEKNLY
jgi:hypothetical protein